MRRMVIEAIYRKPNTSLTGTSSALISKRKQLSLQYKLGEVKPSIDDKKWASAGIFAEYEFNASGVK